MTNSKPPPQPEDPLYQITQHLAGIENLAAA